MINGRVLRILALLVAAGGGGGSGAAAQARPGAAAELVTDALDLERDERYPEAAEGFRAALRVEPSNLSALLGLERVLKSSRQLPTIFPQLQRALSRDSRNPVLRAIELRVWTGIGNDDSVTASAERWIQTAPESPDPYHEWAGGLLAAGRLDDAQRVLGVATAKLGQPPMLPDLAQLAAGRGQWVEAARLWHTAVAGAEQLADLANENLTAVPEATRPQVLTLLSRTLPGAAARRMAADLELGWGHAPQAWALLEPAIPADRLQAEQVLQRFADRARLSRSRDSYRVRGVVLERLAGVLTGVASERARVDAARAYADAGDAVAAERMLTRLAADSARAPTGANSAMVLLIAMMADNGRVEEAEAQLREWSGRMNGEDAAQLRQRISWAWIVKGDFLTAKTVIADDSSIGSMAIRGWMALFTGDLKIATKNFRAAGPGAGTREQAVQRTQIAGLIQRIEPDSVPDFGRALLLLAQGDTTAALTQFATAAESLPPRGGRADVLFYAGQVAEAKGDHARAQPFLAGVLLADPQGAVAPVAEFHLAQSLFATGNAKESQDRLEHLILTYPQSALVPQARRMLDRVRGRTPG
ncbi:MAG: tetratricopeptide repeat protein [Gemmatimonadetes bacterium]|nr:tetratricopeptide repeat protein [Gemmatimonadota bacterium]